MSQTITIERGSDLRLSTVLMDASRTPIDLTGYDVRLFEASEDLGAVLAVSDAENGIVTVSAEWKDSWETGRKMSFRIQISVGGRETAWPQVWIRIR